MESFCFSKVGKFICLIMKLVKFKSKTIVAPS